MEGSPSNPRKSKNLGPILIVSILMGVFFGICSYFRRALSTGFGKSFGRATPDHDLGEALITSVVGFVIVFLVLFFQKDRKSS
jgi:hypothetical protein